MIKVVGVGPGAQGLMTFAGKSAIDDADIVIGAMRHLQKWNTNGAEAIAIDKSLSRIAEYMKENKDKKITVLASGEPMIFGIASYLRKHFEVEVINGISSLQYLFSKTELNMNDLYITSTHGKSVDFQNIERFKKVAMVTDAIINPQKIACELIKLKSSKKMIVGENLSYSNEKIYSFESLEQVRIHDEFGMNAVILYE